MATEITTTPQDIMGDFDLMVIGVPVEANEKIELQKALGSGGTDFVLEKLFGGAGPYFVKNSGTNAYRIKAAVPNMTIEFNQ